MSYCQCNPTYCRHTCGYTLSYFRCLALLIDRIRANKAPKALLRANKKIPEVLMSVVRLA